MAKTQHRCEGHRLAKTESIKNKSLLDASPHKHWCQRYPLLLIETTLNGEQGQATSSLQPEALLMVDS